MVAETIHPPITVTVDDIEAVQHIAEALQHSTIPGEQRTATIVTSDGQMIDVAAFLVEALQQLAVLLAQGDDVVLVPVDRSVSLSEATTLLNVSRSFLTQLLDAGELTARGTGDTRRLPLRAVVAYKMHRHVANTKDLAAALAVAQEAGSYD